MTTFTSTGAEKHPIRRRRRRHASFIACTQVRVCVRTGPRAHTPEWLLIFETTLITKKRGSEGQREGGEKKIAPLGQKQLREL